MIGSIRGTVTNLSADHCLLENNGIGYRIFMPVSTLSKLKTGQDPPKLSYVGEEIYVHDNAVGKIRVDNIEYNTTVLELQ